MGIKEVAIPALSAAGSAGAGAGGAYACGNYFGGGEGSGVETATPSEDKVSNPQEQENNICKSAVWSKDLDKFNGEISGDPKSAVLPTGSESLSNACLYADVKYSSDKDPKSINATLELSGDISGGKKLLVRTVLSNVDSSNKTTSKLSVKHRMVYLSSQDGKWNISSGFIYEKEEDLSGNILKFGLKEKVELKDWFTEAKDVVKTTDIKGVVYLSSSSEGKSSISFSFGKDDPKRDIYFLGTKWYSDTDSIKGVFEGESWKALQKSSDSTQSLAFSTTGSWKWNDCSSEIIKSICDGIK